MDKILQSREHIISMLEKGELREGEKLPGARDIASTLKISLLIVQSAISTLVHDGILETVPRQGTFVHKDWRKRILHRNFVFFSRHFSWIPALENVLESEIPELKLAKEFENGIFEMRTTLTLQRNVKNYMDLSELFDEAFPDKSIFFKEPFKAFRQNGALYGIPFIFSPRVLFYNPEFLKKHGCPEPESGWTWKDFITKIKFLRKKLPPEQVCDWQFVPSYWMNFIFMAGGSLLSPGTDDPVQIDSAATMNGMRMIVELRDAINPPDPKMSLYPSEFFKGNSAFMLMPREELPRLDSFGMNSWKTVALPFSESGFNTSAQATDLICIRKECADKDIALRLIRLMLSEKVQDIVGGSRYGIPVLRSSALKSINMNNPSDRLFYDEISNTRADYNMFSTEIMNLVQYGIDDICCDPSNYEKDMKELAGSIRTLIKIQGKMRMNQWI